MQKLSVYFLIVLATVGCAVQEPVDNTRLSVGSNFSTTSPISIDTNRAHTNLPDWVLPELSKYPVEIFFFDIGIEQGSDEKAFEKAVAKTRAKAAQRIVQRVQKIIRLSGTNLQYHMILEHYSTVLEHYKSASKGSTTLQLEGFSVRNLSVDLARTDWNTYAFVYIGRNELKQLYAKRAAELRLKINQILANAQAAEKSYDIEGAVRKYLSTYPLYEELKEAEIIQVGVEYAPQLSDAFTNLVNAAMADTDLLMSHRKVVKRVEELERALITSVEDVANAIKSQLARQINRSDIAVLIDPFTYRDSMMISEFSRELQGALQKQSGWHSVDRMRGFVSIKRTGQLQFSGSYWENGDEITVRATLRDVRTGDFRASAVVRFLKTHLRSPIAFKPPNYEQAQTEMQAFAEPFNYESFARNSQAVPPKVLQEDKSSAIGGLVVEVRTNKGSSPLYYTEGETMTVFGRVNQPVYLRLLYILADGRRTLLHDNHYIGPSEVNNDVKIGEFECVPPFGTELLIVAARTKEFPQIDTYEENGYSFLVDQDPGLAARKFRGMKPKTDNNNQPSGFQQSEAQLVLTTIEK